MIPMEVTELFTALESNNSKEVEHVKHTFYEQFNNTREPCLLNGMYDYFIATESQRAVEVLVAIREPHDKYFFDRLGDSLQSANRLGALTLLGLVVKKQPPWLIKIRQHNILKEIIKIIKTENEIIIIISALLVVNILFTVIPTLISPFLPDIFLGFSRLVAWPITKKNQYPEIHLYHLQTSSYVVFAQLYSMYPCSFILFLKQEFSTKEKKDIFNKIIKPMIETMRMHPDLIISSKDMEISPQRWKNMEQHDIVMECTKYTLLENRDNSHLIPSNETSNSSSALETLKSVFGATGGVMGVNSINRGDLWSPMLSCGELFNDPVKSIPTTPNIQAALVFNHNEHSPPEAAVEATPETTPIRDVIYQQQRLPSINSTVVRALNSFGLENLSRRNSSSNSQPSSPLKKEGFVYPSEGVQSPSLVHRFDRMMMERNQITVSNKSDNNVRSESKLIGTQIQQSNNLENIQIGGESKITEFNQQSNDIFRATPVGEPLKSSCVPVQDLVHGSQIFQENTSNVFELNKSTKNGLEFPLTSVRSENLCPKIEITNESDIATSNANVGDGHYSKISNSNAHNDNHVTKVKTVYTQTDQSRLPYEHLLYCMFPTYNDNKVYEKIAKINKTDESISLIEQYVRTSAIVVTHLRISKSSNDVKLLHHQIHLLGKQLQFERYRREVHAERNRRLLGQSRKTRALEENNAALRDQVMMLQSELEYVTLGFEKPRKKLLKQVNDLKESVSFWQNECLKYQEETKEAKNKCQELDQLYNGERTKTFAVTKQLSETQAELFNTLSELSMAQAAANVSSELKNTVTNLQRELVMCGEIQSQQRDVVTHVNALRREASNAMLSQDSYRHQINELQNMLDHKTALCEASNYRIADLEQRLNEKNVCIQSDKIEIELVKEHYSKQLTAVKEECRKLKEMQCQYEENKKEEISKSNFFQELPKFGSELLMVESNTSVSVQDAEFRLSMITADNDSYNKFSK